jgi:hypothetical protein
MGGVSDDADLPDTEPEPDTEGPDADHAVPAELVGIYEGMEWQRLVALGPNEQA